MKIGYARVSTLDQDLEIQVSQLHNLGVDPRRVYADHGLTGRNRARPGLRQAIAACRAGDELVVTKLDRLARSMDDARDIAQELHHAGVTLVIGRDRYDPDSPMGNLLFNVLAMVAEFESDLIRARTREGMALARQRGRLRGSKPKLSKLQHRNLLRDFDSGEYTAAELAAQYGVSRATMYRALDRARSEVAQTESGKKPRT